jgi:hypothetical protein
VLRDMAAPSAWPPPPELRALYAPPSAAPGATPPPLPPLPPPPPREAFTAFGVTHPVRVLSGREAGVEHTATLFLTLLRALPAQVVPPAPQLHAAPLYDDALPVSDELRRLNKALLAAFTVLLGCAAPIRPFLNGLSNNAPLNACRALGEGAAGYDAAVHEVAVLLSNCAHLLNEARTAQAQDALEAQLRHALRQRTDALQTLRHKNDAAEEAAQTAQQALLPALAAAAVSANERH